MWGENKRMETLNPVSLLQIGSFISIKGKPSFHENGSVSYHILKNNILRAFYLLFLL
jgi:hypothetical protein